MAPSRSPEITTAQKHIFSFLVQQVSWRELSLYPAVIQPYHPGQMESFRGKADPERLWRHTESCLMCRIPDRDQWFCPPRPYPFNKYLVHISSMLRSQVPVLHGIERPVSVKRLSESVSILPLMQKSTHIPFWLWIPGLAQLTWHSTGSVSCVPHRGGQKQASLCECSETQVILVLLFINFVLFPMRTALNLLSCTLVFIFKGVCPQVLLVFFFKATQFQHSYRQNVQFL